MAMQSQIPEKENNSEQIYQYMVEEVFDVPKFEKSLVTKNFLGAGFSNQIVQDTELVDNLANLFCGSFIVSIELCSQSGSIGSF